MTLKKGKYTLECLLRHTDRTALEALKELPLLLVLKLGKALGCAVHAARSAATLGGHGDVKAVGEAWLPLGGHKDLYVCKPSAKLPKWVGSGDVLTGR